MNFPDELDKLAKQVAAKAASADTPLQESVDALKALTPYYALLLKRKPDVPQDDGDAPSFRNFQASLDADTTTEESPNGGAQVRSRRRRN